MERNTFIYAGMIVVAIVLAVVALYGFGGYSSDNGNQNGTFTNQEQGDANLVRMSSVEFVPRTLEVEVGDEVTWRNEDNVPHTITGFGVDVEVASGDVYSHTFDEPGTYSYNCTIHPGMEGTVQVTS